MRRAPHGLLFPRSLCVVHHGGIGTTAEAIRAGKPQIIVPFFGDQPDHGARVARLGLGLTLRLARYDDRAATDALATLLRGAYRTAAEHVSACVADEVGVDRLAEWAAGVAASPPGAQVFAKAG